MAEKCHTVKEAVKTQRELIFSISLLKNRKMQSASECTRPLSLRVHCVLYSKQPMGNHRHSFPPLSWSLLLVSFLLLSSAHPPACSRASPVSERGQKPRERRRHRQLRRNCPQSRNLGSGLHHQPDGQTRCAIAPLRRLGVLHTPHPWRWPVHDCCHGFSVSPGGGGLAVLYAQAFMMWWCN